MAITTYGELKTAVGNWLERDDLSNRVPEFISLAEDRIYNTLRVREMETSATISTTASQRADSLPSNYLQARRLYIDDSIDAPLEFRTPFNFYGIYASQSSGKPRVYTIEGENVLWAPTPDGVYSVKVLYYQRLTAFSSDSDTNNLLTKARGLFLYGALLEAAPFLGNDPRVAIWAQMWDDIKDRIEAADQLDRASGSPLVQRDVNMVM